MATARKTPKRVTETLTISLDPGAAALLRQRAQRLHRGNVSALVADMIEDARISEHIAQLIESEQLREPSPESLAKFDRQMAAARAPKKRGRAA